MDKDLQQCLNKHKDLQEYILDFFTNDFSEISKAFDDFKENIENQQIHINRLEFMSFLYLLSNISNNYHRTPNFIIKIEYILQQYKNIIKSNFTDTELFKIFKSNKRILLFLIEEKMITMNDALVNTITKENFQLHDYPAYFYPEIKQYISAKLRQEIEAKISKISASEFEEKRKNGENDNNICNLIRTDSIDTFRFKAENETLPKTIEPSIFETNQFLLNKKPTLIEYAAFCGSLEIFNYLKNYHEKSKLTTSIWLYAIHGNNPEIIQTINNNDIRPKNDSFLECYIEAVKCHHLDIIEKISEYQDGMADDAIPKIIEYYNFAYFPDELNTTYIWYNLNYYNYAVFVKIFIENQSFDINMLTILNCLVCFNSIPKYNIFL